MPLTARRTGAWRPDDEPPVEEWRREGMVTATQWPTESAVRGAGRAAGRARRVAERGPRRVAAATLRHRCRPTTTFYEEIGPLPSRVPGHHLSHQPSAPVDVVAAGCGPAAAVSRARTADSTPNR